MIFIRSIFKKKKLQYDIPYQKELYYVQADNISETRMIDVEFSHQSNFKIINKYKKTK